MTARALILASVTLLCGCVPTAQPQGIVGRFMEHIDAHDNPPWRDLIGDFDFDFRSDGKLHIHRRGGWTVEATYKFDGDVLTINDYGGDSACRSSGLDLASGAYRVRFTNIGMELRALRDDCRGRRESMTLKPLVRLRD